MKPEDEQLQVRRDPYGEEEQGDKEPTSYMPHNGRISRRKVLSTLGAAGAALMAGGLLPNYAFADSGNANGVRKVADEVVDAKLAQLLNLCCFKKTTIANLRALNTIPSDLFYYITDFGAEGVFRYDAADTSSSDNLGTVLVSAAGGRFKRVVDGMASVKWFGVKGDGSTDNTSALAALPSGIQVYFPDGIYVASASVLPSAKNYWGTGVLKIGTSLIPVNHSLNEAYGSNIVLPVPAVFATIYTAMDFLNNKSISPDITVTIEVSAGTYDCDQEFQCNHPDGDRIRLIGAGKATTVLKWMGPDYTSFISLEGGERLGYVNGFTLDGNSKRGYHDDARDAQAVLLRRDCYIKLGADILIKEWARCGILAYQGSTVLIEGSTATYAEVKDCGSDGIVSSAGSNIYARYVRISGCQGYGFYADQHALLDARNTQAVNNPGTFTTSLRGGAGYIALSGSTILANDAVASGNAASGIYANQLALINATGAVASGNGVNASARNRHGIFGLYGSVLYLDNAEASNNAGSGIYVSSGSTAYGFRVKSNNNGTAVAGSAGIYVTENANFDGSSANCSNNTGTGLKADKCANVTCHTSTFSNNTTDGVNAQQAQVWLGNTPGTTPTITGNGGWGVIARFSATVQITSGTGNITGNTLGQLSPAANISGLSNSYIHG
jgi:hypothetical protein